MTFKFDLEDYKIKMADKHSLTTEALVYLKHITMDLLY